MTSITFSQVTGLGSMQPELPPEAAGAFSEAHFPSKFRALHRAVKSSLNRVPKKDPLTNRSLRDEFLACIAGTLAQQARVESVCRTIGEHAAVKDLLEKRISNMTIVDFIVDAKTKAQATPDQATFQDVKDKLLAPDRERFAKVQPSNGKAQNTEWSYVEDDNSPDNI